MRLGEAQALLDRELVKLIDDGIRGVPVERGVGLPEGSLRPRVGNLLDADDDVHCGRPTSLSLLAHAGLPPRGCQPGQCKPAKRGGPFASRVLACCQDARLPASSIRSAAHYGPHCGHPQTGAGQDCRSARLTTFASNIALVIGPTPPGIFARWPATSATSGCTSPESPTSVLVMPTSSTAAPGLIMSAVTRAGFPAAATTM